tara:strand:+ start:10449 stop:11543 length:1095 start_codon:yes stop_codon:yes gene_type:complete
VYYAPFKKAAASDWGVVCTCREPTQLVVAFAAHYVGLGAREVRLFLDQAQPDLEKILAEIPQVIVQVCDAAYWKDIIGKPRPETVEYRQLMNIFHAYKSTKVAWLAHFDADEFLHSDVCVDDLLSAQPMEIDFAVVEPRERAFVQGELQQCLFDGVFRQPLPHNWGNAPFLFGAAQRFLRQGVLGYPHGKSFVRTGQAIVPGIHTPRRPASHRREKLRGWAVQRARLLHFDGLTSLHWSAKLLRAAAAGGHHGFKQGGRDTHRVKQVIRMRRLGNSLQDAWTMHEMLKVVPQDQIDRLRTLAVIEDYTIDPMRDIDALNLSTPIDLSRAAFDRALTAYQPDVSAWLDPWEALMRQGKRSKGAAA